MDSNLFGRLNIYTMEVGDGRDIELTVLEDNICWRRVGDKDWNILVPLSRLEGYSPVVGIDYWTEEDKAKILDYIDKVISEKEIPMTTYIHYNKSASDTWTIFHRLNRFPSVTIVDSADNVVTGDVTYIDQNTIEVKFNGAFSGKAFLN